jgi:hypothetical protein
MRKVPEGTEINPNDPQFDQSPGTVTTVSHGSEVRHHRRFTMYVFILISDNHSTIQPHKSGRTTNKQRDKSVRRPETSQAREVSKQSNPQESLRPSKTSQAREADQRQESQESVRRSDTSQARTVSDLPVKEQPLPTRETSPPRDIPTLQREPVQESSEKTLLRGEAGGSSLGSVRGSESLHPCTFSNHSSIVPCFSHAGFTSGRRRPDGRVRYCLVQPPFS